MNLVLTSCVAAEDRRVAITVSPSTVDVDVVGEHRAVELHRQAAGDVAALVGGAEQDEVGASPPSILGDGRGDGDAGQLPAEVAGGETFVAPYSPSSSATAAPSPP